MAHSGFPSYPTARMRLSEIRFSQATISDRFRGAHGSILDMRDRLQKLYCEAGSLESGFIAINNWFRERNCVIAVVEHPPASQKYYTMDNRRLWCVKSVCVKLGIEESAFELAVLLHTREQQSRNRHGRDETELKLNTANEGASVVVQHMENAARIEEKWGTGMKECQFYCDREAILKLKSDSQLCKTFQEKHSLQAFGVELHTFDQTSSYIVSLVADELTMQRKASAIYLEVQALASASATAHLESPKDSVADVFARLNIKKKTMSNATASTGNASATPSLTDSALSPLATEFQPASRFNAKPSEEIKRYCSGLDGLNLPIDVHRDQITIAISANSVTIIRADTGSGKTTRVPLFVRDYHHRQHLSPPKILMTQPRRVATICAAQRMAQSLGQDVNGTDGNVCEIGYMIRGQSRGSSDEMTIAVCTTGWLLNKVQGEPDFLQKWDYIVLDEVHERTIESDFMALICKDALLGSRREKNIKLIIMSATVEAELFESYFKQPLERSCMFSANLGLSALTATGVNSVGIVDVPVYTHRKFVFYLEDLVNEPSRSAELDKIISAPLHTTDGAKAQSALPTNLQEAVRRLGFTSNTSKAIKDMEKSILEKGRERADVAWETAAIVQELIQQLGRGGESILVVLPGLESIFRLHDHLNWTLHLTEDWSGWNWDSVNNEWKYDASVVSAEYESNGGGYGHVASGTSCVMPESFEAFVLHSSIPIEEQERACKFPPSKTFCRVYLASNLAESSLTLPNVRVVIDTGLHRQNTHDPLKRTSALETRWVSQASVDQRTGRTGRNFAGISIRLYPKAFHDRFMQKFESPVINIAPMEKTLLQVMALAQQSVMFSSMAKRDHCGKSVKSAQALLDALPTPPQQSRVDHTLLSLAGAGAITSPNEQADITMLGHTMLLLELEAELAAVVLHSIIWGSPVDGIVVAAAASCDTPLIPEAAFGMVRTSEVGKRNKQLLNIVGHFSESVPCEHTCIRNLIVNALLDFSDHKNSKIQEGTLNPAKVLRKYLVEWRGKFCDRPHVRRMETIMNMMRDLAEKAAQNTLDRGLQRDLRKICNLFSKEGTGKQCPDGQFEETAELQRLFEATNRHEFQGLLIAAFAPNFVALKSRLVDTNPDIGCEDDAKVEPSDAVLKERRLLVDMMARGFAPESSFILEPHHSSRSFPTGPSFARVQGALQSKLAQISRTHSVKVENFDTDKKLVVQFDGGVDVECLTDDEDDTNHEYIDVIKDYVNRYPGAYVSDIVSRCEGYQQLKRQVGLHNPRKLYDFLRSGSCDAHFTLQGVHNYTRVYIKNLSAGRRSSVSVKKYLPKFTPLRGCSTLESTPYQSRSVYNCQQFSHSDLRIFRKSSLCGQLLDLQKGRRPMLTFEYQQSAPNDWPLDFPSISISSVSSPFALTWQISESVGAYFQDSDGELLPAWEDNLEVERLVDEIEALANVKTSDRQITAFTENKLLFTLLGYFDKSLCDSVRQNFAFGALENRRSSGTMQNEEFVEQCVGIENRVASIGLVVGKGGVVLSELKDLSGCDIELPSRNEQGRPGALIRIRGPPVVVPHVVDTVEMLLSKTKTSLAISNLRNLMRIVGRENSALSEANPAEGIARKMVSEMPKQVFGVYQKASLNIDAAKRAQSAVLTGVSVINAASNPNMAALLLLLFGSSRIDLRATVEDHSSSPDGLIFSRIQAGKAAIVDNCSLPGDMLTTASQVREEISRAFEQCLPSRQEPRFVRSDSAASSIKQILSRFSRQTSTSPSRGHNKVSVRIFTPKTEAQRFMGTWSLQGISEE